MRDENEVEEFPHIWSLNFAKALAHIPHRNRGRHNDHCNRRLSTSTSTPVRVAVVAQSSIACLRILQTAGLLTSVAAEPSPDPHTTSPRVTRRKVFLPQSWISRSWRSCSRQSQVEPSVSTPFSTAFKLPGSSKTGIDSGLPIKCQVGLQLTFSL